jgi:hypothetical protein
MTSTIGMDCQHWNAWRQYLIIANDDQLAQMMKSVDREIRRRKILASLTAQERMVDILT